VKIKILGKVWDLKFVNHLGYEGPIEQQNLVWGDCSDPNQPNKTIRIRRGISELESEECKLAVFIHEFQHAAEWSKDEEYVRKFGEDLARYLWRLGYRQDPEIRKKIEGTIYDGK